MEVKFYSTILPTILPYKKCERRNRWMVQKIEILFLSMNQLSKPNQHHPTKKKMTSKYIKDPTVTIAYKVRQLSSHHPVPKNGDSSYNRCVIALRRIKDGKKTIDDYDYDWRVIRKKQPHSVFNIDELPPPPEFLLEETPQEKFEKKIEENINEILAELMPSLSFLSAGEKDLAKAFQKVCADDNLNEIMNEKLMNILKKI